MAGILSLAVGGGKLFAVFILSLLIVIPFVRFDIFVVPLQSKLWMFPFLSFMAGFGSLACIMLSGEILSTMHGGYDDER